LFGGTILGGCAFNAVDLRQGNRMKFIIQVLKLNGAGKPQILHAFAHSASSVHMVRETMKALIESPEWPLEAKGFRIVSETGSELYRWPEKT
jgi:coenzyme F420-reducing hydrogenase delta subunit